MAADAEVGMGGGLDGDPAVGREFDDVGAAVQRGAGGDAAGEFGRHARLREFGAACLETGAPGALQPLQRRPREFTDAGAQARHLLLDAERAAMPLDQPVGDLPDQADVSCTMPYCSDARARLSSRSIAVQSSRTSKTSRAIE